MNTPLKDEARPERQALIENVDARIKAQEAAMTEALRCLGQGDVIRAMEALESAAAPKEAA